MRPLVVPTYCAAVLFASAMAGCQQAPVPLGTAPNPAAANPTAVSQLTLTTGRQAAFSGGNAWAHLRALTQIGPRVIDTQGHAEARDYIQTQLSKLNLEVEVLEHDLLAIPESEVDKSEDGSSEQDKPADAGPSLFVRNIHATIPGELTSGSILLIAPYDTQAFDDFDFVGANDGGSGAALLLELGRVIAADPLPYTTELVFLDGHAPFTLGDAKRKRKGAGMVRLAAAKREGVSDIHLVVYINRIGDAELKIARDLLSHRVYREKFFDAARRLGHTDAFPQDAPFVSIDVKLRSLALIGLRRTVSIIDASYGGDESPGQYAGTEQDTMDHCSPESLDTVGSVVLEGLEGISELLTKIERFAQYPLDTESTPEPESEPESQSGPASDVEEQEGDDTQN